MTEKNSRFINPVGYGRDLDLARDEPSHIHIARPSRLLRRTNAHPGATPSDRVRDPDLVRQGPNR
jgi:hypothetical protein